MKLIVATHASNRVNEWTQDLFLELATTDPPQLPHLYAIGRDGIMMYHPTMSANGQTTLRDHYRLRNLLPLVDTEAPLQMLS